MVDDKMFGLGDDEFLNQAPPVVEAVSQEEAASAASAAAAATAEQEAAAALAAQQEQDALATAEAERVAAEAAGTGEQGAEGQGEGVAGTDGTEGTEAPKVKTAEELAAEEAARVAAEANKDPKDPKDTTAEGAEGEAVVVDYKTQFEQVMAPFKANGKTVQVNTPEEAIKLMQMGANYTRKLQDLQPARKVLMMMEANQLSEERLSYLIDLDRKDPEAIKKLIKDSGIDPLELDLNTVSYQPTNHSVSDRDVNFRTTIEGLQETDEGKDLVNTIHTSWDPESKAALYDNPSIMETISLQKQSGVYDRIVAEVDRRKMLGMVSPSAPFLQAYKDVGDALANSGGFNDLIEKAGGTTKVVTPPGRTVVDTSTAAPKTVAKNDAAAKAAAATKAAVKTAAVIKNPLAQSDEDFMKEWANRL